MSVVTLNDGRWRRLPRHVCVDAESVRPLAQVERRDGVPWVRRRASWIIGRYHCGGVTIEVPSPVPTATLLPLVLFATGTTPKTLKELSHQALDGIGNAFHRDLARVFVARVRKDLGHDPATRFNPIVETGYTLRGRPLWSKMVGRPLAAGVVCRSYARSADHLLNQIIATAVERAVVLLADDDTGRINSYALAQIWRNLATTVKVSAAIFNTAYRKLSPLTERYRVPLKLAEMLLMRLQPDPFHGGDAIGPGCAMNLADLLERVVYRLLCTYTETKESVAVAFQKAEDRCFTDAEGSKYRSVRPDIVIFANSKPVAVLDTKFKPRYVVARQDGSLPRSGRASTADLFQLAFYQLSLQQRYGTVCPPMPYIVVPQLDGKPAALHSRIVRWPSKDGYAEARVIPIPLSPLAAVLREEGDASRSICAAPELKELVDSLSLKTD